MHHDQRDDKHPEQDGRPGHVRDAEVGQLSQKAAGNGAAQCHGANDDLAAGKDPFELAIKPCGGQRVHKPGLGCTREEGETKSEKCGDDRPPDEY